MVISVAQEKMDVIAQQLRITSAQASVACRVFEEGQQGAYLKFHAPQEVRGLSTLQWFKLQQMLKDPKILAHHQWNSYDDYEAEHAQQHALSAEELALILENGSVEEKALQKFVFYCIKHVSILPQLRQTFWDKAEVSLVVEGKVTEPVKALQALWPNPLPLLKKFNATLFLKFWDLRKAGLKLNFTFSQSKEWVIQEIAKHFQWKPAADIWMKQALEKAYNDYFMPRLQRDLLAMSYDAMVEQMLPVVETKWRQILLQKSIGAEALLLLYPHGKSGVMILTVGADGQLLDEAMIYPYAPDYDAEHTISYLAKSLIRKNIAHVALMVQPETKKVLLKTLSLLHKRYPDLDWSLHLYAPTLSHLIPSGQSKHPQLEDVLSIAKSIQSPWALWLRADPLLFLSPLLRHLPKAMLNALWQHMLLEKAYVLGADIPLVKPENLVVLQQQDDWKKAHAWELKPVQLMTPEIKNNLQEVAVGARFQAVVLRIMSYGVFVDLGEGVEGLIHISAMGDCFISDISLLLKEGDVIEVEWMSYDAAQKRLSLKLYQPWKPIAEAREEKPRVVQRDKPKTQARKQVASKEKSMTANKTPTAMELAFAKLKS
jgi:transcriptional accessory protein Tex/SPT6